MDIKNAINHRSDIEVCTLAAGCFWCVEAQFQMLKGVEKVQSGYSGGVTPYPTYEQVCTGKTGHAEVVQIMFNPELISFDEILEVFFLAHDPTQLNGQGDDIGTQYRSAIFCHNTLQQQKAMDCIQHLEDTQVFESKIVTQVVPFVVFYPAEVYHDNYFQLHPEVPYCAMVVRPKVEKIKHLLRNKLM